jgi:hypothetical protein
MGNMQAGASSCGAEVWMAREGVMGVWAERARVVELEFVRRAQSARCQSRKLRRVQNAACEKI